jgi:hypothetical protein
MAAKHGLNHLLPDDNLWAKVSPTEAGKKQVLQAR